LFFNLKSLVRVLGKTTTNNFRLYSRFG